MNCTTPWLQASPAQARTQQDVVREQLQKSCAQKLAVTGFAKEGQSIHYLLDPDED